MLMQEMEIIDHHVVKVLCIRKMPQSVHLDRGHVVMNLKMNLAANRSAEVISEIENIVEANAKERVLFYQDLDEHGGSDSDGSDRHCSSCTFTQGGQRCEDDLDFVE